MRKGAKLAALVLLALPAAAANAGWKLQHAIDFAAGQPLDPAFWSVESGFLRNREKQYYTPANVGVQPGFLRIEARRERVPNAAHGSGARGWRSQAAESEYTSGSIATRPAFLYGRFEIVARSPGGAGVWPALWLLSDRRGEYGEIDIHESVGKLADTAFAGVHYGRTPNTREYRNASRVVPGFEGSWHTHTVEWTPESIVISLDGQPLFRFDPRSVATQGRDPLRAPMRLHLNLALGGNWGGPIDDRRLPAHFDIRSVRIWSWQPGEAAPIEPAAAPAPLPAAANAAAPAVSNAAAAPSPSPSPSPDAAPVALSPRWGR